jgi:hypothetical protein
MARHTLPYELRSPIGNIAIRKNRRGKTREDNSKSKPFHHQNP